MSLPAFGQSANLPTEKLPPFELDTRIRHEGGVITVDELQGSLNDIPLTSSLTIDLARKPLFLRGTLRSAELTYDQLQSALAPSPEPPEESEKSSAIPDLALPADYLAVLEFDLHLDFPKLVEFPLSLVEASTKAVLDDRRLNLNPLELSIAGGTIQGEVAFNARSETPSADIVVSYTDIDIAGFFAETRFADEMKGTLRGNLSLLGNGDRLDSILRSSNGEGTVFFDNGTISGLILEGAGIDIAEALALFVGDDAMVPVTCGRLDFVVENGLLEITRLLIDTEDAVLVGGGSLDLGEESLDLAIESRAKDFSLIDASVPILISGTIAEPSVSLGEMQSLPFFEMGDADPVDCDELMNSNFQREIQTDPETKSEEE